MTQEDRPTRAMDSYGPDEMAIPELKLVQNVGGEEAKAAGAVPGDLYFTLTDEVVKGDEGFDLVVVDMPKQRTYWGSTDIGNEPPICASLDANSMRSMNGDDCTKCEHRCETPWLVKANERRAMCLVNYNVLAINIKDNMPVLIRTSGISTKAVRELLTQLRMNRALQGQYHKAVVHVESKLKKTSMSDAYAFSFKVKGLIGDEEQAKELLFQSQGMLGTAIALPESMAEPEPEVLAEAPAAKVEAPAPEAPEAKVEAPAAEGKEPDTKKEPEAKPEVKKESDSLLNVDF